MHSLGATLHRPVPVLNPNLMYEDLVRILAMAREVAASTGYGQRWITEIVRRYNAKGTGGLSTAERFCLQHCRQHGWPKPASSGVQLMLQRGWNSS